MVKPLEIAGQRFGLLEVISLVPEEERKNKYKRREWVCKCDCGNILTIEQRNLTGKKYAQRSCGCIRVREHFLITNKLNLEKEYIYSFNNFEKYTFLHKSALHSNSPLKNYSKEEYYNYIDYFYNQKEFNILYEFWIENKNKNKTFYDWAKPSLDHIIPLSRGGSNNLSNLQFLTVFENLNKRDMTMEEWNLFKKETNTCSNYYIENIVKKGGKE